MQNLFTLKKSKKKILDKKRTLLIGSPNVGKSTFLNKATRANTTVSNLDRMTTAHIEGKIKGRNEYLVDLPGIYNLSHPISEENEVAFHILNDAKSSIINITSALSLRRDLILTLQCLETERANNLVINMCDEINTQNINTFKLSKHLGKIPVVLGTKKNKWYNKSLELLNRKKDITNFKINYSSEIEKHILELCKMFPENFPMSKRFFSIMLLEGNLSFYNHIKEHDPILYKKINKYVEKIDLNLLANEIYKIRHELAEKIFNDSICTKNYLKKNLTKQQKFDSVILKPWVGIPAFILIVIAAYYLAFGSYAGGYLQTQLDIFLNNTVSETWITSLFRDTFHADWWVTNLFVEGIFQGIFIVITFLPSIIILFVVISIIQQTGMMSRVSVLLDNQLSKIGLSGRSVIALLTGFGCNVPSIMMARSSNNLKERLTTIFMSPFIMCSGRIVVIFGIIEMFFSASALNWLIVLGLVAFSGLVALILGLIFSKTMFRHTKTHFLVEMVPWRGVDLFVLCKAIWTQIKSFIFKVFTLVILFNFIIWLLTYTGPNGLAVYDEAGNAINIDSSFMYYISYGIGYIFYPIGLNDWRLTTALISGIASKEIILSVVNTMGLESGAISTASAVSFIMFTTFYVPCASALATIKKETSWKFLFANIGVTLAVSYSLSLIAYWITFAAT